MLFEERSLALQGMDSEDLVDKRQFSLEHGGRQSQGLLMKEI
jgi:hypothetical protein